MHTMKVTLRTVTPLFLGGAQEKSCELRPPSIKGALRFWFRFIEGARQNGDWRQVRAEEQRLFGSTDTGVGAFRIKCTKTPQITRPSLGPPGYREWPIEIGYMGYGPIGLRKLSYQERETRKASKKPTTVFEPRREFIDANQELAFDIQFRPEATEQDMRRVHEGLWLWTHLGGLGSRARRGWGSLELIEPDEMYGLKVLTMADAKDLEAEIQARIKQIQGEGESPRSAQFTHWFHESRLLVPCVCEGWQQAMWWVGNKFIAFRSNSTRFKKPPAGPHDPCWPDHDLLRNYLLPPGQGFMQPSRAPMRVVFGLPHNYAFGSLAQNPNKASVTAKWHVPLSDGGSKETEIDRRSSPIFVHLHRVQGGVAVIVTYVPACLLPKQGAVEIQFEPVFDDPSEGRSLPIRHTPPMTHVAPPQGWETLEKFLEGLSKW